MKNLAYILLILIFTNIANASTLTSDWENLMTKIISIGDFQEGDEVIPASFGLKDIQGELNNTHLSDYINEWGYIDISTDEFKADYLSMVSEKWILTNENTWKIDQWICLSTLEGELYKVYHAEIVESTTNEILDYKSEELSPASPLADQKFTDLTLKWEAF